MASNIKIKAILKNRVAARATAARYRSGHNGAELFYGNGDKMMAAGGRKVVAQARAEFLRDVMLSHW